MSHRPQVTYNANGEVVMTYEVNGFLFRMRMSAAEADVLGSQIHNMASGARKMRVEADGRQQKLHEVIGGLATVKAIDFDATQVKEKGVGVRVETGTDKDGKDGAGNA